MTITEAPIARLVLACPLDDTRMEVPLDATFLKVAEPAVCIAECSDRVTRQFTPP